MDSRFHAVAQLMFCTDNTDCSNEQYCLMRIGDDQGSCHNVTAVYEPCPLNSKYSPCTAGQYCFLSPKATKDFDQYGICEIMIGPNRYPKVNCLNDKYCSNDEFCYQYSFDEDHEKSFCQVRQEDGEYCNRALDFGTCLPGSSCIYGRCERVVISAATALVISGSMLFAFMIYFLRKLGKKRWLVKVPAPKNSILSLENVDEPPPPYSGINNI